MLHQKYTMFCMKVEKSTRVTRWYSTLLNLGGTHFVPICTHFFFPKNLKLRHQKIDFGTGYQVIGQKL